MDNKETIKYFDSVVDQINDVSLFATLNILLNTLPDKTSKDRDKISVLERLIESFGEREGYFAKISGDGGWWSLTSKGQKLKDFGKGHEAFEKHLEEKNKPQTNNINFIGGNNYGIQSSNSAFKSPTIQTKVKTIENAANKKSTIEIASWIIGILVGLILIYEFVIKTFMSID